MAVLVVLTSAPVGWARAEPASAVTAPSTIESLSWRSQGMDVGPDGVVYSVAANDESKVFKHHPDGTTTLLASGTGTCTPWIYGWEGPNATLCGARNLAVAPDGSVYVLSLHGIGLVRIGPKGFIVPVDPRIKAADSVCAGLDVDATGHIYVWSEGKLQKRSRAGDVVWEAVVGDAGTPCDIAVAPNGDVYATRQHQVFHIDQSGAVSVFAGTGVAGFSGDGGPGTAAELNYPTGLAVGHSGSVFIADNRRIRAVDPSGTISTIAGDGTDGCAGDGGDPAAAQVGRARWLAVDEAGDLYVAAPRWFSFDGCDTRRITRRAALHGTVTVDGMPAAHRQVAVFAESPRWALLGRTTTAADGSWRIDDLPVRPYRVRYVDPSWHHPPRWHGNAPTYAGATPIAPDVDSDTPLAHDWESGDRSGRITGRIVTAPSTPAGGIVVWALHPDGVARGTRTRPDGTFGLPGLAPGTYRLVFIDPPSSHPIAWFDDATNHDGSATIDVTADASIALPDQQLP